MSAILSSFRQHQFTLPFSERMRAQTAAESIAFFRHLGYPDSHPRIQGELTILIQVLHDNSLPCAE